MRPRDRLLFAAAFSSFIVPDVSAQEPPDTRPGVAVFAFENGGSFGPDRLDFDDWQRGIHHIMVRELKVHENALRVVERRTLSQMLEEQGLGTERVDPSTAVRIGRLVGARYAVTGGYTDVFGTMRLDARIVDVETGEVIRAVEVTDEREKLLAMVVDLGAKIVADLNLPPLASAQLEERRRNEFPQEGLLLFGQVELAVQDGNKELAAQLYSLFTTKFPALTEEKQTLLQLIEGSDDRLESHQHSAGIGQRIEGIPLAVD